MSKSFNFLPNYLPKIFKNSTLELNNLLQRTPPSSTLSPNLRTYPNLQGLYIKSPQLIPPPKMSENEINNVFKPINIDDGTKRSRIRAQRSNVFTNPQNINSFTFGKNYDGKKLKFKQSLAYQIQNGGKSLRDYFDIHSLRSESEGNSSCVKSKDKTKATSGHQSIRSKKLRNFMNKFKGGEHNENTNPNMRTLKQEKSAVVIFNTPTKSFTKMKQDKKAGSINCELCSDKQSEYSLVENRLILQKRILTCSNVDTFSAQTVFLIKE